MHFQGKHYRSVWASFEDKAIYLIDQRKLPFAFEILTIKHIEELIEAIKILAVRGAPAIGIAAAYGTWLILEEYYGQKENIIHQYQQLLHARPTAVNLKRGASYVFSQVESSFDPATAFQAAEHFAHEEIQAFSRIAQHGLSMFISLYEKLSRPIHVLTHCNAGWLACGDYGTALAPIFEAKRLGIPLTIFVDETQPLLQGARLTAWELYHEQIPFKIIPDNTSGFLMAKGEIDLVITGADRIAKNGDTANKIGTYSLAVLAHHHQVPFYIAAPTSTFDFDTPEGKDIIIEERSASEVIFARVWTDNHWLDLPTTEPSFPALNYAFDVTPHELIHGYITDKGIISHPSMLL